MFGTVQSEHVSQCPMARGFIAGRSSAAYSSYQHGVTNERMHGAQVVNALATSTGSPQHDVERVLSQIVELAPNGVALTAADGRILLANAELQRMFGYARAELLARPIDQLLSERFRPGHAMLRAADGTDSRASSTGTGREFLGLRADGAEFPIEIGVSAIETPRGIMVLETMVDISGRKRLEQANANLEEFAYAVSHDLKSPLRGIAALIEWIIEDLGRTTPPKVARNLERVGDRIRRLEQIVDDLLTYARAGTASTDVLPVEPRALLAEVLEIQPLPPSFLVSVHVDAMPLVTARTPLQTVLRNVIGNAVKHHDLPAGNIEIHVEDLDRYCVFTISDDGPGIAPAAQERVFRMFQTLAPPGRGGSGIGLALSKRLVEAHGGRMTLSSADGARGTSFRIWWPRFPME